MERKKSFNPSEFLAELQRDITEGTCDINLGKKKILDGLQRVAEAYRVAADFDFRKIGDHLYDGIYISDGVGKTVYINKAYTRITGITAEEIVGRYVSELENEDYFKNAVTPQVIKYKRQVNSMGESSRNGTRMLITGNPIFDEMGNVVKVVVIDRDITDLLHMQTELEATQLKMKAVEADTNKNKLEIEHLRQFHLKKNLIGRSLAIQQIFKTIRQVAGVDVTVLISGETGVGKEVVANEIYSISSRKNGPFIKVNCAAIPGNLLEAELFGYEKGAFTGAGSSGKMGMFELADKGTILLDEIGEMPLELQSKLLRVIQHKEITRIGGSKPVKLDVRIISSTNCELRSMVQQGKFREDLYYRLNVFPIHIPPLRARVEDISVLVDHLLEVYNTRYGKTTTIEQSGYEALTQYGWPGNVRELQNIIERLVIISDPVTEITVEQIANLLNIDPYFSDIMKKETGLKEIVENIERKTIEKALTLCGSTRKAAQVLKVDQSTIVKKAKRLGIQWNDENRHR